MLSKEFYDAILDRDYKKLKYVLKNIDSKFDINGNRYWAGRHILGECDLKSAKIFFTDSRVNPVHYRGSIINLCNLNEDIVSNQYKKDIIDIMNILFQDGRLLVFFFRFDKKNNIFAEFGRNISYLPFLKRYLTNKCNNMNQCLVLLKEYIDFKEVINDIVSTYIM